MKKKKRVFEGILAAVMVFVLAACSSSGGDISENNDDVSLSLIEAKMTEDGIAYIPLMDGTAVQINDDVSYAVITRDREHIVVLLEDGLLYVTDCNQEEKTTISDHVYDDLAVADEGILYWDDDDILYRYRFSDGVTTQLGDVYDCMVSTYNLSVMYADWDGGVYTLSIDSEEPEKVGNYEYDVSLIGISNDATVAVWKSETDDEDYTGTVYLSRAGEREKLYTTDETYDYSYVYFTEDQDLAVINSRYSESMWIVQSGEETVTAKLGAEPYYGTVYSENGVLSKSDSSGVSSVYLLLESTNGMCNVYNVTLSGDRERVLSNVEDVVISNGTIAYTDTDGTLYGGKVDGAQVTDEVKISSDVEAFEFSNDGAYVYYLKDCDADSKTGTLYCYEFKSGESQKVATDVYASVYTTLGSSLMVRYGADREAIWFYEDVDYIRDTYSRCGNLMKWAPGDESPTKIASDVIVGSVDSGLAYGELQSDSFVYVKYGSVDEDGNIYGDWMYWDGTESARMVQDIRW